MIKSDVAKQVKKTIYKRVLIKIGNQDEIVCFWHEILNNCMVAYHSGNAITIKKYD